MVSSDCPSSNGMTPSDDHRVMDRNRYSRRRFPSPHALRTVPVGAGVINIHRRVTTRKAIHMASHRRRAAEPEAKQCAFNLSRQTILVAIDKLFSVTLDDLSDRYAGAKLSSLGGFVSSLPGVWSVGSTQRGHCRVGSQSSGQGAAPRCCLRQYRYTIVVTKLECPSNLAVSITCRARNVFPPSTAW